MDPIVSIDDVTKVYRLGPRRVTALRGATLQIERPGFDAIMGPSGSGKSTLLHLLGGLDRPDAGAIHVGGERIDRLGERRLDAYRRRRVGIVFQQFNLISTLSALDNVTLPGLLDGMPPRTRRERGLALLERMGLVERADHRPDALSGGEQQRIALARALLFSPPLILADEPTGNLDSVTSEQIWRLLAELAGENGSTVVMVTHEPAAAVHCRRVFMLGDGRITDTIDVENLDAAELATRAQHARG